MRYVLLFLLSSVAWAQTTTNPTVTGVAGASSWDLTTGTPTIRGGIAGATCTATNDVCNSCTVTTLTACNQRRIYDSLVMTLTLSNGGGGRAVLTAVENSTILTNLIENFENDGTTVRINWGKLCSNLYGTSCESIGTTTSAKALRIRIDDNRNGIIDSGETRFVDVNFVVLRVPTGAYDEFGAAGGSSQGVGGFYPHPGDEKIFFEDPIAAADFPSLGYGGQIKRFRVFMSDQSMAQANPAQSYEPEDLVVDGNDVRDAVVDGLTNGVRYAFRVAMVDEAENVVQFFPSTNDANANGCSGGPPVPDACPWASTPDPVLGLLSEDFNCFIASAAYGSSLEPKLETFRKFRFKILSRHEWGLDFIRSYYKYGPYAARFIHDKPVLRAITRGLLWPLYGFSKLALSLGFVQSLALVLTGFALVAAFLVRRSRA